MKSALFTIFLALMLVSCKENTTTPKDNDMIITDDGNYTEVVVPAGLYSNPTTLGNRLEKVPQVGDFMNDFLVNEGTEDEFSFTDFRDKVVYLNFWRTRCHFCVDELPDLVNNYNVIDNNDFVVITVSSDIYENISFEKVFEFIEDFKMDRFINIYDGSKLSNSLNKHLLIPGTPYGFLIDKEGKIVSKVRANNTKFIELVETELAK